MNLPLINKVPATSSDDQQLTGLSLSGTDLTVTLEDGGSQTADLSSLVSAPHPPFNVVTCAPNHIRRYAGFQGQVFPVTATNFNDQILGWLPTQNFTAACDGFVFVSFNQPWGRTGVRDSMNQTYVDVRLLRNGVAVDTSTNYTLWEHEHKEIVGTSNNVDWKPHSYTWTSCVAATAGDVFVVEHRYKTRILRDTGPQTYNRLLIYRERATFVNIPAPIVAEVTHG